MTPAPWTALSVTLAVQTLAAVALTTPSVMAPAVSPQIGVGAQHVGWLISLAYLAAMVTGLGGGALSQRHGPVRISQVALTASAIGLALMAIGHPAALLAGAAVLGVGYGLPNPTAAEILSRHAPAARRGLFFSIKQTGVPLGVAFTGMVVPALMAVGSWTQALLVLAVGLMGVMMLIGRKRSLLEGNAAPAAAAAASPGSPTAEGLRQRLLEPLREVLAFAPTRRLAIASLVFAFTQVSFLTFLVSLLKLEHGYSLPLAASLLAASQAASVVGRIGWGHVADRWVDPARLLGALGVAMGLAVALVGLAPADASASTMLALTLACAVTAVAWNGVFFADLVRLVPPERVARSTGATQFLTFMGGVGGSAAFATLVSLTGSYSVVFTVLGVLPALTGLVLLAGARRPGPGPAQGTGPG
ncbi:MAG: MFS transporter [Betaproteobacteria bacterium]|nr:MFS transporter [Betaproteobacteria bacterium]